MWGLLGLGGGVCFTECHSYFYNWSCKHIVRTVIWIHLRLKGKQTFVCGSQSECGVVLPNSGMRGMPNKSAPQVGELRMFAHGHASWVQADALEHCELHNTGVLKSTFWPGKQECNSYACPKLRGEQKRLNKPLSTPEPKTGCWCLAFDKTIYGPTAKQWQHSYRRTFKIINPVD